MIRFLVSLDELVALVRARVALNQLGQQEFADTLGDMLGAAALDVSNCD